MNFCYYYFRKNLMCLGHHFYGVSYHDGLEFLTELNRKIRFSVSLVKNWFSILFGLVIGYLVFL